MKPGRPRTLWLAMSVASLYPLNATPDPVFTWQDSQGVVHFSDRAPAGRQAQQVEPAVPVLVPMQENLGAAEAIAETIGAKPVTTGRARPPRHDKETLERQCERYRRQLDVIQSQLRAGYSNAEGNRLKKRRRSISGRLSRECLRG